MLRKITIFDCTLREAGYQTGWNFDKNFVVEWYQFLLSHNISYMELGFFHSESHDSHKGIYRYSSEKNKDIAEVLYKIKSKTKLSSMLDIQRPLSEIKPKDESIIDCIRIINRSHENDFNVLEKKVIELKTLGYEVCVNFTSAGYNTQKLNKDFIKFSKENDLNSIYFADTESVFTRKYVENLIENCDKEGVRNYGLHFHDKKRLAQKLFDIAFKLGCKNFDTTLLGFGGKWHDWNLSTEFLLEYFNIEPDPVEFNNLRRDIVQQIVKYNKFDTTVIG